MAAARVRHEGHHADGAGVYVDAVRLHENGVTYGTVERSGASATAENEKPSLAVALPSTKRWCGRSIFSNTNAGLETREDSVRW